MLEFDVELSVGGFELRAAGRQTAAVMGLFGPSGSGKTTLLDCLAGLLRPSRGFISLDGEVFFDGSARRHLPPHRRAIGYVFQDGRLFPHLSVRANVAYSRCKGGPGPNVAELAEVLDLGPLLERSPATLSGGEKQRVALARALAAGPRLLLLDEPLASLDGASKLRLLPYLARVHQRWRIPFIYVSHSLSEVLFLTEKAWQMRGGRIVRTADTRELLTAVPGSAAPLVNILEGVVEEVTPRTGFALASCRGLKIKVPQDGLAVGEPITAALPANALLLATSPPRGLSARNVFEATVRHVQQNCYALWVVVKAQGQELIAELTEEAARDLRLAPGKRVYVAFKSHSLAAEPAVGGTNY
jgi:molybdate transport system ATP-binding protein